MARKFLTALDLAKNELQNAAVQSLASAPSSPVKFQLYGNSGDNTLYWWNGSSWVSSGGFPGYGSVPAETTYGLVKADGSATTLARSDHTHGTPPHTALEHVNIPLSALAPPTIDVNFNNRKITGLGDPTVSTDAANKQYVDNAIAGLSWKDPVRATTTANITLSGAQAIDGVAVIAGDRVLVKDQSTASANGIYVAAAGAWTRAADADVAAEIEGLAVWVLEGTSNGDKAFVCTTNAPITVDTTGLTFVQFGAGTAVTAGAGLSGTSTFNVGAANGSITVGTDDIQVGYAGTGGVYGSAVTAARSDHTHTGMARKYAGAVAAATSSVVNHLLNTRDVVVNVYRTGTPWDSVECDVERTDANNVTVRFATAPTASEYTVVVVG